MQEQAAIFRFLISKYCLKRIKLSWTEYKLAQSALRDACDPSCGDICN